MGTRNPVRSTRLKAVLGPTNTGKTHLAIERMCAHSSGMIGFPLRLLAREVYDKVCAIKGADKVALITGEERIEPKNARYLLCTAEAMPVSADLAFAAIDEAQLGADRERGHIFTDRLLHARGRDETMILGSATLEPMVRALLPDAEIVSRPRFSTLSHAGARKLSRIPPRSAIVAFSAEQVYAVAEMLRRFRGGAAVVMGALSPETRNRQVALYQNGEVDYLVATDAIGMGLNLDIDHVAFAGLSKFDGVRQRRLTTSEMAQIAGRAGRHQRDGTFGTLAGSGSHDSEFTPEEVYAIEEHRFPPLTKLFWREAEPDCASLSALIADLSRPPERPELAPAPEAVDLAVLRRLAEDPEIAASVRGPALVQRFWATCSLPDFRQHGAETHARFAARLWQDLRHGQLGGDYVAKAIADLDNPGGDIDTLQMRIAAIRTWAYVAQRPDWVLAKEEMAARARAVETRLSDALHARLTERFVNRRTSVLMKKLGPDAGLLPVTLEGDEVRVDGEPIGHLAGFRFRVDPLARLADRKLLLAAAERHLPELRVRRAEALLQSGLEALTLEGAKLAWEGEPIARLEAGRSVLAPRILLDLALDMLPGELKGRILAALEGWLGTALGALAPLRKLEVASAELAGGPELRALLIRLIEQGGLLPRADSGLERLAPDQRDRLRKLGVRVGALDLFVPDMLKPAALASWRTLCAARGSALPAPVPGMPPVVATPGKMATPPGYRRIGKQALRLDIAEKLLRAAHEARVNAKGRPFTIDPALAISTGLATVSYAQLLRLAGFNASVPRPLREGAFGPPQPASWRWRPVRREPSPPSPAPPPPDPGNAFAALATLVR
ncbi:MULTISPECIES: helicase-related protein [unclassified Novosphingobium]|uniref:helicase-related protein n=1 Tax=unclassified Novosphingobium TaxID=2644732 RepID=UPI000EED4C30|nr:MULTISPECIES: helicase-related protein [unclassified Novosphingobium]HCF24150.1 helicase [Novosphingobium sp.]HQV02447.1 helicase-related protein [Novosphingobium sp.]